MSNSILESLISLGDAERSEALAGLTDEQAAALLYDWRFWARQNQLEPVGAWRIWIVLAGRGFGKTRIGAEWTRSSVQGFEYVNIIGATADDARDIMIEGESGILAVCPPWERPEYRKSSRRLDWPNGAKTLIFTADEPERLRGKQHMRLWADELAAWRYPEAWDQAVLGLRLGADPRALITTTPRPTRLLRDLVEDATSVVTKGSTYENRDNLAPGFFADLIGKYEGTRLGRQELEAELLLDEGLAYRLVQGVHVVKPFDVPDAWERFESMDYGSSNPTAWYPYAVDYDGNVLVVGGYYQAGLPSEIAPVIRTLRAGGWEAPDGAGGTVPNTVWADPSIWNTTGTTNRWGQPASTANEFIQECNLSVVRANNDRRAGYLRVAEMLKQDEQRRFPAWHPLAGEYGAPRLFIFDIPETEQMRDQILEAPLEEEGEPHPGEAVSRRWEGPYGHAHASLRYGLMSRPSPSAVPARELDDPRAELMRRNEERWLDSHEQGGRYEAA